MGRLPRRVVVAAWLVFAAGCSREPPPGGSIDSSVAADLAAADLVAAPDLVFCPALAGCIGDAHRVGQSCVAWKAGEFDATCMRPNFTARDALFDCPPNHFSATVCNRGGAPSTSAQSGTFYWDPACPPTLKTPICTAPIAAPLAPGACAMVQCQAASFDMHALWFRADDDGKNFPLADECDSTDDDAFFFNDCTLP